MPRSENPSLARTAVVTGAAGGIGSAVSLALFRAGWNLVLAGRSESALDAVAQRCVSSGASSRPQVLCVPTDVTRADSVDDLMEATSTRFGRVDMLFNNAGINAPSVPVDELALEDWRRVIDTNLTGMFHGMRSAFRQMKRQDPQGGRIINNGSVSAQAPRPDSFAYTAAKTAVTGLTRCGALDGRKFNIAVGQIDIGNALTDMAERMTRGVMQADGRVAVEPVMDAAHVADAIVHMASLPLDANFYNVTLMASHMPLVGRG